jgi:TolB protein
MKRLARIVLAAWMLQPAAAVLLAHEDKPPAAPLALTSDGDFKQHLAWSPDGKQFLFTRIHQGKMGIWTMNADGSELRRLFKHDEAPDFDGCWSPDSRRILFVFIVLQGTDGKLHLHRINADGTDMKVVMPNKAFEESPRWSRDGKRFAFVSTRDGNQEIYAADADGKNIKRLTSSIAADANPTWSPDGKQIAFASHRGGNWDIHVMNDDGTNLRKLTDHAAMDYWPVWSPDGKSIAFTSNRDGNYEIYVMDADGANPRNLSKHAGVDNHATWSPDSKKLAWISNRSGAYEVVVQPLPVD